MNTLRWLTTIPAACIGGWLMGNGDWLPGIAIALLAYGLGQVMMRSGR